MKIGIFGGTFDPPHWGHLLLAEFVRDEMGLDRVLLVPALFPPHKEDRIITDAQLRLEMVKILCGNDPYIRPSDADLVHGRKPSYTIDLLEDFFKKFPGDEFFLIVGGDSVVEFTTWHRWDEILSRCVVVALPRPGRDFSSADRRVLDAVKILKSPLIEISSTEIRRRVCEGKSIRFMTTEEVAKFIAEKKLYSANK
ncbi:nicotinate-nucleotide adenylyltransferase [bacterium]|nr:nicotinate-nucleotide adenylyltransferase [bacterium]